MTKKIVSISVIAIALIFGFAFIKNEASNTGKNNLSVKQDAGMTLKQFSQKVNDNEKLVFVYFNADWCVPCIKLKPTIDQLAIDQKHKIILLRIDVDENPIISTHFEVNGLPLFMIYKKGKSVWTHSGSLTKQNLEMQIELWSEK